jgi:hypothetical protein
MKSLIKKSVFVFTCLLLIIAGCTDQKGTEASDEGYQDKKTQEIQTRNAEAWEQAQALKFKDSDFLETKEPMSTEAINPPDPETGLVGDKAYNQMVYLAALDRIKKHSYVKDNQVYTTIKSGAEINMAEDLYDYIVNFLYEEWNTALQEGRFEIQYDEKGLIWAVPVQKKK